MQRVHHRDGVFRTLCYLRARQPVMLALLAKARFATVAALLGLSALALVWPPAVSAQVFQVQTLSVTALDENGAPLTIDDVTRPSVAHEFRPVFEMPTTNRSITRWYRFVAPRINAGPLVLSVARQRVRRRALLPTGAGLLHTHSVRYARAVRCSRLSLNISGNSADSANASGLAALRSCLRTA